MADLPIRIWGTFHVPGRLINSIGKAQRLCGDVSDAGAPDGKDGADYNREHAAEHWSFGYISGSRAEDQNLLNGTSVLSLKESCLRREGPLGMTMLLNNTSSRCHFKNLVGIVSASKASLS